MYAVVGPQFTNEGTEKLDSATQSGLTLSFLAIIFGSSSGWVPVSGNIARFKPLTEKLLT